MSSALLRQLIAFPASLLLGGWLALISYSNLAQAKTTSNNVLIAQTSVERLPPPPPSANVPYNQQSLPELRPSSPRQVIEFQQQPQPSDQVAPVAQHRRNYSRRYNWNYSRNYNQAVGSYLVYVNDDNTQLLQQVRQIEPRAYIRQFQGRSVIQAGAFSREYNAQQRLAQLRSYGINRTQIVSFSNGEGRSYSYEEGRPYSDREGRSYSYEEGRPYSDREGRPYSERDDYGRNRSKSFYVAIPAKPEELPLIESRIRQSIGLNTGVIARNHPRGSHVAVGPFAQQFQADQWNNYLRNLGFANARVYYGR